MRYNPIVIEKLKELQINLKKERIIFKGRLFYPIDQDFSRSASFLNGNHEKGYWIPLDTFIKEKETFQDFSWTKLEKKDWMKPKSAPENLLSYNQFLISISTLDRPIYIYGENKSAKVAFFLVSASHIKRGLELTNYKDR